MKKIIIFLALFYCQPLLAQEDFPLSPIFALKFKAYKLAQTEQNDFTAKKKIIDWAMECYSNMKTENDFTILFQNSPASFLLVDEEAGDSLKSKAEIEKHVINNLCLAFDSLLYSTEKFRAILKFFNSQKVSTTIVYNSGAKKYRVAIRLKRELHTYTASQQSWFYELASKAFTDYYFLTPNEIPE